MNPESTLNTTGINRRKFCINTGIYTVRCLYN